MSYYESVSFLDALFIDDNIANEAFDSKAKLYSIIAKIENFFVHAGEIIRRLLFNFKKIRRYSVPKVLNDFISSTGNELKHCVVDLQSGKCVIREVYNRFSDILKSQEYIDIFSMSKDDFEAYEFIDINTTNEVNNLKDISRSLEKAKVDLNNIKRNSNSENEIEKLKLLVQIVTIELRVASAMFSFGRVSKSDKEPFKGNSNVDVIDIEDDIDIEVEDIR